MATSPEDLHLRLQLVPLDVLQALSVSADDVDEQSVLVAPVAIPTAPAHIVVTACSPNTDGGVTAGDVGIRLAAKGDLDGIRRSFKLWWSGVVLNVLEWKRHRDGHAKRESTAAAITMCPNVIATDIAWRSLKRRRNCLTTAEISGLGG